MKVSSPSYREYIGFVATVLVTFAVLQYIGILFGNPGGFDLTYLAGIGILLPICTYLLTVILANVEWLPQWDRMVRSEE